MCPLNSTGTELLTLYSLRLTLYCCFFLFLLPALWGFCGFCSSTRDWSSTTAVKAPSPNQWIRELPLSVSYLLCYLMFISYSNPEAQKSSLILSSPPIPDLSFSCSVWVASISGFHLVAQMVKNLPTMPETPVQSLGWKDTQQKGIATHSNILVWEIPRTEEPGYSPWGREELDTFLHLLHGPSCSPSLASGLHTISTCTHY